MTPDLEALYERAKDAQRDVNLTKTAYEAAIAARKRAFAALREAGEPLSAISNVVAISRQAIDQIAKKKP